MHRGVSQEDSPAFGRDPANGGDKGVPPLAARSGFNTPIAESNGKYKIDLRIMK